jgi:site-specific DNA-methyltransferase (adenine-specific)
MRVFQNIDCLEGMKEFPDKHFDLAIVDVPYGIGEGSEKIHSRHHSQKKYTAKTWDNSAPENEYFNELRRVSKNQIIWGANHFISKNPIDSSCWIVWDKDVYGDFADCELAWTSFDTAVRKFKFTWNGFRQGYSHQDKEDRIHPTQKPVTLYKWLLQKYAKPGDKILDTHVGSASSLIAFEEEGFDYVGFEIDKEYYDNAVKRIDTYRSQLKLF